VKSYNAKLGDSCILFWYVNCRSNMLWRPKNVI